MGILKSPGGQSWSTSPDGLTDITETICPGDVDVDTWSELGANTSYSASVKRYTNGSGRFSDSSEEVEFTMRLCHLYSPFVIVYALGCIFLCCSLLKKIHSDS